MCQIYDNIEFYNNSPKCQNIEKFPNTPTLHGVLDYCWMSSFVIMCSITQKGNLLNYLTCNYLYLYVINYDWVDYFSILFFRFKQRVSNSYRTRFYKPIFFSEQISAINQPLVHIATSSDIVLFVNVPTLNKTFDLIWFSSVAHATCTYSFCLVLFMFLC